MKDSIISAGTGSEIHELIILGGKTYHSTDKKVYMPLESLDGVLSSDLPIGIEFIGYEDGYYDDGYRDGFETRNYKILRESEKVFRVTIFTLYTHYLSLEFDHFAFSHWKKNVILSLTTINPRIEECIPRTRIITYSFEVVGRTFDELILFASTVDKDINNRIMDAVRGLPERIRFSLGLIVSAINSQQQPQSTKTALTGLGWTDSKFEKFAAGIDRGNANDQRVVVSVEYPSEYWDLEMKVEWFMILKAELIQKWSLFSPKIEKNDLMNRVMEYSVEPTVGTDEQKIEYAKTLNGDVNDLLVQESQKILSYIEKTLGI